MIGDAFNNHGQIVFFPGPIWRHEDVVIVASVTGLGPHVGTRHLDPGIVLTLHVSILLLHVTRHLCFEPPRALDIRGVVCRVVGRPDEAPGARPQLGDGVPALASPVPGHVARQVQLRVGPQDDLGQRETMIMIMLPKMRKCENAKMRCMFIFCFTGKY